MSEQAPERSAPSSGGGGEAKGGAFARKIGPLPVWAWMGIGLVAALGISAVRGGKQKNKSDQSSQAAQNLAAQQQAALQNAAMQTPPYVTQNYASSAATASAAASSTSTATIVLPPTFHQGQGWPPPPGVAGFSGWPGGPGGWSMSSPQAWQPRSAHGTPDGQGEPRGGQEGRHGDHPGVPPSGHPGTPSRPGRGGGGRNGGHESGGQRGGRGQRGGGGRH